MTWRIGEIFVYLHHETLNVENYGSNDDIHCREQWARHEQFVEMLRAVKQRKRERQTQIEMRLKEEEEYVRKERARLDAIYKDLDDEII